MPDCCKIKLRSSGYRLVYQVHDKVLVVTVIAVGKRDKGLAYLVAKKRV
jgi:mRNA interferase RelE/StbE